MSGGYVKLFSTYTDAQILELARHRDGLVGAAREALDEELRRRRYDPDDLDKPAHEAALPVDPGNLRVNVVSRFFLRAPSWQIFLMVCVVGFFTSAAHFIRGWGPVNMFAVSLGATVLATICEVFWQWSLGTFLNRATISKLRMKNTFFFVAIALSLILLPLAISLILYPDYLHWTMLIEAPAVVCTFYIPYFISKSLILAERSRPVSFHDYLGPLLMILFLPIGIWTLQPRVNRLFESKMNQPA